MIHIISGDVSLTSGTSAILLAPAVSIYLRSNGRRKRTRCYTPSRHPEYYYVTLNDVTTQVLTQHFHIIMDLTTPPQLQNADELPPTGLAPPPPISPFTALDYASDSKFHLLLACTGSVATIKLPLIASTLVERYPNTLSIHVLLTTSAAKFLETPLSIKGVDRVWTDEDEWSFPQNKSGNWERGDPVLHIELRRWADMMVIAPLSANSMAKMAGGLCDNLLLSVVRAWDTTVPEGSNAVAKKIIIAPAMNTAMWNHPITEQQTGVLEGWKWVEVLKPVEKTLACGDVGAGAMREWQEIVEAAEGRSGLNLGRPFNSL